MRAGRLGRQPAVALAQVPSVQPESRRDRPYRAPRRVPCASWTACGLSAVTKAIRRNLSKEDRDFAGPGHGDHRVHAGRGEGYDSALVVGVELEKTVPGDTVTQHLGAAAWTGHEGAEARYLWPSMFAQVADEYDCRHGLDDAPLRAIAQLNFAKRAGIADGHPTPAAGGAEIR